MAAGLEADLQLLTAAAKKAGQIALRFFRRDPHSWMKAGNSPVSDADIAVDRFLADFLGAARPDYGWLSEETQDDLSRLGKDRTFVVDPIDGTREFLAGGQEWMVCLAIVENGRPIAAALSAPALNELYTAGVGKGAFMGEKRLALVENEATDLPGARLVGPRRYLSDVAIAAGRRPAEIRFVASLAYRLTLVAAGRAEVAVGRRGASDWDLAAADLLVGEAGGVCSDVDGRALVYNREETSHPPVVASAAALAGVVRHLIAETIESPPAA